jgi:hypothetical protein
MKDRSVNDTPLIPTYLKPLAVRASCRKRVTDFYLRCDGCGGETFAVLRDRQEKDPIDTYLHSFKLPVMSWDVSAEDKKGRRRITVRTFFGIPMGRCLNIGIRMMADAIHWSIKLCQMAMLT